jgi:hypothetical protein
VFPAANNHTSQDVVSTGPVTVDNAVDNASGDWRSGATVGNSGYTAPQPQYNAGYSSAGPTETTDVTQPQYSSSQQYNQAPRDQGVSVTTTGPNAVPGEK